MSTLYVGKLTAWPLNHYHTLDTMINSFLRKITLNMPTFPEALLYTKSTDGGLGFIRFSDRAHDRKLSFFRRFDIGHPAAPAMSGLVSRGLRAMGAFCPPRAACTLKAGIWGESWWITSLVDWLAQQELSLRVHGRSLPGAMGLLAQLPDTAISLKSRQGAIQCGMSLLGELSPDLLGYVVDDEPTIALRVGQCWTGLRANGIRPQDVMEIAGFLEGDSIEVLLWVNFAPSQRAAVGDHVLVFDKSLGHPSGFPTGSGTKLSVSWRPLFRGAGPFYHVLLSKEVHARDPVAYNVCEVLSVQPKRVSLTPFHWQYIPQCPREVWDFCADAKFLYVDGSYRNDGRTSNILCGRTTTAAVGAGVVKVTEEDQVEVLYIRGDQEYNSVFLLELQALLLCRISAPDTAKVFSDSEAAIATTQEGYKSGPGPQSQLINGLRHQAAPVEWIKAHVPREDWGEHNWGNDMADRVAKGEFDLLDYDPPVSRFVEVDDTSLLGDLAAASLVSVVDCINNPPTMAIDVRRSHWETQHYKWKRDDDRAKRTTPNGVGWPTGGLGRYGNSLLSL